MSTRAIHGPALAVVCGVALCAPACLTSNEPEPVSSKAAASVAAAGSSFTEFESGQVRPLALSPDGKLLFAVNTPDNRLEIFRVLPTGLRLASSVTVGLEPVAVAAASDTEVWVVNHLSDSVSIVDLGNGPELPRITSATPTATC